MVEQVVPVIMLVAQHAKGSHFECPVCGCAFKISVATYMVSFHMMGKREVTCPSCGYRDFLSPIHDDES
ncbi:MAG: hypothetical protein ACE3JK_08900 [Sporolactobacillus sp.]